MILGLNLNLDGVLEKAHKRAVRQEKPWNHFSYFEF